MTDPFSTSEKDDNDNGPQQIGRIIRSVDGELDHHAWPEISELSNRYVANDDYPSNSAVENAIRNKISTIILN